MTTVGPASTTPESTEPASTGPASVTPESSIPVGVGQPIKTTTNAATKTGKAAVAPDIG